MTPQFRSFACSLNRAFTAMELSIADSGVFDRPIETDAHRSLFFIDAHILHGLVTVLREDGQLLKDLEDTVQAHRTRDHWTILLESAGEISYLQNCLRNCEAGLVPLQRENRAQTADVARSLDGELAVRRRLADRRNLASRINKAVGSPLVDGLTMRGLLFVLAEQRDLRQRFQQLIHTGLLERTDIQLPVDQPG